MAYITQSQAAVYSSIVGALSATVADALLDVASDQVDAFCARTFDTVLDGLPNPVAMAVALWAEELTKGTSAGRESIEEKIGDYMIKYNAGGGGSDNTVVYPCPSVVATLLAPYRIVVVG
jgi:hypothetical protein